MAHFALIGCNTLLFNELSLNFILFSLIEKITPSQSGAGCRSLGCPATLAISGFFKPGFVEGITGKLQLKTGAVLAWGGVK